MNELSLFLLHLSVLYFNFINSQTYGEEYMFGSTLWDHESLSMDYDTSLMWIIHFIYFRAPINHTMYLYFYN